MIVCPCCDSHNLQITIDKIFHNDFKFLDCLDCDCLYVQRHDTGEWIESSSINTHNQTGITTGHAKIRERCSGAFRSVASEVGRF